MRTIRDRLLEAVANNLGDQVAFCDDDDLIHHVEEAARSHPSSWAWWRGRRTLPTSVAFDLKAIRQIAAEGSNRTHE